MRIHLQGRTEDGLIFLMPEQLLITEISPGICGEWCEGTAGCLPANGALDSVFWVKKGDSGAAVLHTVGLIRSAAVPMGG